MGFLCLVILLLLFPVTYKMCSLKGPFLFIILAITLNTQEAMPVERSVVTTNLLLFVRGKISLFGGRVRFSQASSKDKGGRIVNPPSNYAYECVCYYLSLLSLADHLSDGTSNRQEWLLPILSRSTDFLGLHGALLGEEAMKPRR